MRDILFRGKRKDNGEWIYGWYQPSVHELGTTLAIIGDDGYLDDVRVDPKSVGQFTGLLDCGDNKLYEHDVVTAKFKSNGARFNFRIVYRDGAFTFDNGSIAVRFDQIRSAVLIGNTIDSPDWKRLRPYWWKGE
jgi:hypothetical protein